MSSPELLFSPSIRSIDDYLKDDKPNPIKSFFGARIQAIPPIGYAIVDLIAIVAFSALSLIPPLCRSLEKKYPQMKAYTISSPEHIIRNAKHFAGLIIGIPCNILYGIIIDTNINIKIQKALGLYDTQSKLEKPTEIKLESKLNNLIKSFKNFINDLNKEINKYKEEEHTTYRQIITRCKSSIRAVERILNDQSDKMMADSNINSIETEQLEDIIQKLYAAKIILPEPSTISIPKENNVDRFNKDIDQTISLFKELSSKDELAQMDSPPTIADSKQPALPELQATSSSGSNNEPEPLAKHPLDEKFKKQNDDLLSLVNTINEIKTGLEKQSNTYKDDADYQQKLKPLIDSLNEAWNIGDKLRVLRPIHITSQLNEIKDIVKNAQNFVSTEAKLFWITVPYRTHMNQLKNTILKSIYPLIKTLKRLDAEIIKDMENIKQQQETAKFQASQGQPATSSESQPVAEPSASSEQPPVQS